MFAIVSGCASARHAAAGGASIERALQPAQFGASAGSTIVRIARGAALDARWLVFDPLHPERVQSFAMLGDRARLDGEHRRAMPEAGTFEPAEGFAFERWFAASEGEALVLVRWSEAQGAVDPRTVSRTLIVLSVSPARVEPTLQCGLFFSVTEGPDRADRTLAERSYRVEDRSIVVSEGALRSRATLERGRWRIEGEPWCAPLRGDPAR